MKKLNAKQAWGITKEFYNVPVDTEILNMIFEQIKCAAERGEDSVVVFLNTKEYETYVKKLKKYGYSISISPSFTQGKEAVRISWYRA